MKDIKSKKNIVVVDGYGFLFRAFFSLQDLTTKSGTPIGAVYGFINMILKLKSTLTIDYLIMTFDSGKKSFRNEIYTEYKSNRAEAPEALKPQFAIIREAMNAMSIKYIEKEGYEADDVIASIVKKYKSQENHITIVTSDKDLMQLVEDDIVTIFDPIKLKFINEAEVVKKFNVKPKQVIDFLSIVGDASDNIPGVFGIGEKGAGELLSTFSNLEEIYENIESITKTKIKNALIQHKEDAFVSKKLVSLNFDIEIPEIENFKPEDFKKDELFLFLKKHDLNSILAKVLPDYTLNQDDLFDGEKTSLVEVMHVEVKTKNDIKELLNKINEGEVIIDAIDDKILLETNEAVYSIKLA